PLLWQARHDLGRIYEGTGRAARGQREEQATDELRTYADKEKTLQERLEALKQDGHAVTCSAELALTHRRFAEALSGFDRAPSLGADAERIAAGRAEACLGSGDRAAGVAALRSIPDRREARGELARATAAVAAGQDPLPLLTRVAADAGDEYDVL